MNASPHSSNAQPNCSAPPTPPTHSSPPTSPAAPSPRPSPISTRRSSPPRAFSILDAGSRDFHRLGAPVLRAGIERADELHAALLDRNRALEAAGYHAQVAVTEQSSLLFLIDAQTGARLALKRTAPTPAEPNGLWQAGKQSYSTADLVGILESEPERISPSALLRPVFQDFLLSTSLFIGGPAEIAYLAQSAVLYERILGRQTTPAPRFFGTLIEPAIAKLLQKHELSLEQVFTETPDSLAQRLAARSMPIETKQKLAAAGNALDTELTTLVEWMQSQDKGLGQSAETAEGKIRYQMNRLRTLAANFQLQKESTLTKHAESLCNALCPGGVIQERVHGAAYYLAKYGLELAETLSQPSRKHLPRPHRHLAVKSSEQWSVISGQRSERSAGAPGPSQLGTRDDKDQISRKKTKNSIHP